MPRLARAAQRRQCALSGIAALQATEAVRADQLMDLMRRHARAEPSGNGDLCMHAAGLLRPTGTTNAMVVRMDERGPQAWFTGCSHPCLSLYHVTPFSDAVARLFPQDYWLMQQQKLSRFDAEKRRQLRAGLAQRQGEILSGEVMA